MSEEVVRENNRLCAIVENAAFQHFQAAGMLREAGGYVRQGLAKQHEAASDALKQVLNMMKLDSAP